jgi:preprotein translocase subunit SecF
MGRKKILLMFSLVLVVSSVLVISIKGINLGIEFTGGTELRIKFAEEPDVGRIRSALTSAGMTGQDVTTLGDPGEHEIYIRLGTEEGQDDQHLAHQVREALKTRLYPGIGSGLDLNIADSATLANFLEQAPMLGAQQARELAESITDARKENAIFGSLEDIAAIEGMTPEAMSYIRSNAIVGPMALRGQSYIGPAIGHELLNKAMFAIFGSLVGMLIYIWIRFQLQWGFAAVVALSHDTLIVLGLFALVDLELSLPVVAAYLTLVGYSVNDTVVVFDRIRENLKSRSAPTLEALINTSINQTLSRTIITSGSTWIVVFGLYLFGGAALKPFSFVLSVGVLVGTYSSIYVASPILVLWKQYLEKRELGAAKARKAKKVRRGSTG